MPLLSDFGVIVAINITVALLSALIVLPPILVWADQRNWVSRGLLKTPPPQYPTRRSTSATPSTSAHWSAASGDGRTAARPPTATADRGRRRRRRHRPARTGAQPSPSPSRCRPGCTCRRRRCRPHCGTRSSGHAARPLQLDATLTGERARSNGELEVDEPGS